LVILPKHLNQEQARYLEQNWPKTYPTYDITHKKKQYQTFFSVQARGLVTSFESLDSSL